MIQRVLRMSVMRRNVSHTNGLADRGDDIKIGESLGSRLNGLYGMGFLSGVWYIEVSHVFNNESFGNYPILSQLMSVNGPSCPLCMMEAGSETVFPSLNRAEQTIGSGHELFRGGGIAETSLLFRRITVDVGRRRIEKVVYCHRSLLG